MQVKIKNKSNNPFYGLKSCLRLFQNVGGTITESMLNDCWVEVKNNKEHREMFFSLLFSVGDITARQHNIFKGAKRDSGGNANREGFYTIFLWLKAYHKDQFIKFLNAGLFNEYTCFDMLFRNRVQTKGKRVIKVFDVFSDSWYREELLKYVYAIINGNNPFNKMLIAKFLTIPRLSKRSGHKRMLEETRILMEYKAQFLIELSKLIGWEYIANKHYCNFKGYRKWRQEYNGSLESVMFSTGKINEFDQQSFITWFDKLPAQARFRVKNRILYSKVKDSEVLKWEKFIPWVNQWENFKEQKQAEQRVLEEKVRQNQASEEDKARLEKVKKQAKVNVGATNFNELYSEILDNRVDKLKLESFINKVNLPYNSLVIIDDSGSMRGRPFNFATFIAAVCLVKNPDDDGRNLLGFFDGSSHWYSYIDRKIEATPNSIFRVRVAKVSPTPFVDPKKSFYENYKEIKAFCDGVFRGGMTNISAIPENLRIVCKNNPAVLDALQSYPVWTIISDGEWNNLHSPEASINNFMRRCENYFGFKPFIVAIDIAQFTAYYFSADRFSGIDNMIYIPSNPAQIEQFLTNFKDMDIFDVYTPLQSIHRSNRYELIRENTI